MAIVLRWYQQQAVDAVFNYWQTGQGKHPLLIAPCGAGKSIMLAEIVRRCMVYEGTRVLVVTHRQDLISQNYAELHLVWPEAYAGIYSAGLRRRDTMEPVIYAGEQSIHHRMDDLGTFDVVIVDEAHLIPRASATRYGRILEHVFERNPSAAVVGLTATAYRSDSGYLHTGDDAIFDGIAYDIPVQTLLDEGHLVEVVAKRGANPADLSGVKKRAGEFNLREMAEAFSAGGVTEQAIEEVLELGKDRRAWLIFCTSIAHAEEVAETLRGRGIDAGTVTSKTPPDERSETIARYKRGDLRCLVNVDVLTTGFNAPICDLLVMLRGTHSTSLYVQIVGRVMRVHPEKKNGLLLDYGGNVERHGAIDAVDVAVSSGKGDGEAPVKACPQCATYIPASVSACPQCGYEYPPRDPDIEHRAFEGAVLKSQIKPEWRDVDEVSYSEHRKTGAAPSVRVNYYCSDGSELSEWWLPEHGGYAARRTAELLAHRYSAPMPSTTAELLDDAYSYPIPNRILVERDGKYWRIKKTCGTYRNPEQREGNLAGFSLR